MSVKRLAIIALCVLCMGAAPKKPGVYTVTIKVDTTYVKTGATEDGVALYRQKIDTTEVWASQADVADSVWSNIHTLEWHGALDSVTTITLPYITIDTLGVQAW